MAHRLTLHQLCLRDVDPVDLPGIAARAGLDSVTVFVMPPSPDLDIFPRVTEESAAAFLRACSDNAVSVHNVEVFSIGPDTQVNDYIPALDLGQRLGASRLTALVQDADLARAGERISAFADLAAARGMAVSIEFMKFSELRSIGAGAAFLDRVNHPNLSLLVDPLHLIRTGGTVADLVAINPVYVGSAQLCDGPLEAPKNPFGEAVENRGVPGEGAFPLADFLAALPADCPIDIEVPMKRFAVEGMSPDARAHRVVSASQALVRATA